jgi:hypothetical protein
MALTPARSWACGHGIANVAGGVWPLVHMGSFERVVGPKTDRWLVRTVAGLLAVNGSTQIVTALAATEVWPAGILGIGTAATLAGIDLAYAPRGRISRVYLLDAALELAAVVAWGVVLRGDRARRASSQPAQQMGQPYGEPDQTDEDHDDPDVVQQWLEDSEREQPSADKHHNRGSHGTPPPLPRRPDLTASPLPRSAGFTRWRRRTAR